MSYKLLSFKSGGEARAGLLVGERVYDAARVTGESAWATVLGALQDWPKAQREFIELNKVLAQKWQPLIERKPAPADADEWAKKKDKKNLLER